MRHYFFQKKIGASKNANEVYFGVKVRIPSVTEGIFVSAFLSDARFFFRLS